MQSPLLSGWRLGVLEIGESRLGAMETPKAWRIGWANEQYGNTSQRWQDEATADTYPYADSERIRWQDSTACVRVVQDQITLAGVAVELARLPIALSAIGIIETIGTWFEVTALDSDELALFSYSSWPPGADPCQLPLTHPDPEVENPLTLTWRLIADQRGYQNREVLPVPGTILVPSALPSVHTIEPDWADLRYAYESEYTMHHQQIVKGPSFVRLFCIISGDPDRWVVRMRGRVQGYWQGAGHRGAALDSALRRS